MNPLKTWLLAGLCGCVVISAHATEPMKLEVIQLRHRMADDLIPIVKPLTAAGTTVTGTGSQLIIRASQSDLATLTSVIAELDQPLRQLMITVRNDVAAQSQGREHSLSGRLRGGDLDVRVADPGHSPGFGVTYSDDRSDVRYRTLHTRSKTDDSSEYRVQTLEGRPALIQTGTAVPVPEYSMTVSPYGGRLHEGVRYHDLNSGFYVVPKLNQQQVTLDIYPYSARIAPGHGGVFRHQDLETSVRGRLGDWIPLGGVDENVAHESGVAYTQTRQRGSELREIWVRVEEL